MQAVAAMSPPAKGAENAAETCRVVAAIVTSGLLGFGAVAWVDNALPDAAPVWVAPDEAPADGRTYDAVRVGRTRVTSATLR
jgi:hypothetical protein